MSGVLVQLTKAVELLGQARTLDDVMDLRSFAASAEAYARAEKLGDEAEHIARDIRVRAGRKAGAILAEMARNGERHPWGRTSEVARGDFTPPKLTDLGITKTESHRWQKLAAVPEDEFERLVAAGKSEDTIARAVAAPKATPKKPKVVPPKAKTNGYTLKQSLRGLQHAAMQIEGLAEGLDGRMLGDWSRLYNEPEAQPLFDAIERSLPLLTARLKAVLRERGSHVERDIG